MPKLSTLHPNPTNPRTIKDSNFDKLVASIKDFPKMMALRPMVTDADGMILGGNMRLAACIAVYGANGDIPDDWVICADKLTDDEIRRFIITDNAAYGEWDIPILLDEYTVVELQEFGLDLEDLDIHLDDSAGDPAPEDDAVPELDEGEPITQRGDIWTLGEHRLLCGDALDGGDVALLMDGKEADMIFIDPPYNLVIGSLLKEISKGQKVQHRKHGEFAQASGEMSPDEFIEFLRKSFENLIANSRDGSIHYVCMDWKHVFEIMSAGRATYAEYKQLCVWNKDNGGMGTFYRSKHELIFVFKNGTAKHTNNFGLGDTGRYRTNVWDYAGVNSFTNNPRRITDDGREVSMPSPELDMHPTVKPLELVTDAILDCSNPGNIIVDTFIGSGTTLIAAEKTNRVCYGAEIDEHYCDVILKRWSEFTGGDPVRSDGVKWSELQE